MFIKLPLAEAIDRFAQFKVALAKAVTMIDLNFGCSAKACFSSNVTTS